MEEQSARTVDQVARKHDKLSKKTFRCKFRNCNGIFASQLKLSQHHSRDHLCERHFPCAVCSQRFTHEGDLRQHYRDTHPNVMPFACTICGKRFISERNLNIHRRVLHLIHVQSLHTKQSSKRNEGSRGDDLSCKTCGVAFSTEENLQLHKKPCLGEKRPFKCCRTGETFSKGLDLVSHLEIHHSLFAYRCFKCKRLVEHSSGLREHLRSVHQIYEKT